MRFLCGARVTVMGGSVVASQSPDDFVLFEFLRGMTGAEVQLLSQGSARQVMEEFFAECPERIRMAIEAATPNWRHIESRIVRRARHELLGELRALALVHVL